MSLLINKTQDATCTLQLNRPDKLNALNREMYALLTRPKRSASSADMGSLLNCEKPIIASVDGPAIGIGATLLFHCALVCASHSARFQTPFTDLGVCPEFASSETFPAVLGSHRAAQMLLLGEPMSAEDAERFGLVNKSIRQ